MFFYNVRYSGTLYLAEASRIGYFRQVVVNSALPLPILAHDHLNQKHPLLYIGTVTQMHLVTLVAVLMLFSFVVVRRLESIQY